MVSRAAPALTKIGFRRNVRTFLTLLVGFFVVLIFILMILLQTVTNDASAVLWRHWNSIGDRVAADIAAAPASDAGSLQAHLEFLRGRHGVEGIELVAPGGRRVTSGVILPPAEADIVRNTAYGRARIIFDSGDLDTLRTTFRRTAIISIAGTVGGLFLFLLFLPSITRPIEQLLDQAQQVAAAQPGVDETNYLLDTFRTTIARLKEQEAELQRLHDLQKTRADELERVTATLTRSLTSGFIAIDANGSILDMNAAARQILGLQDTTFTGFSISRALGPRNFARVLQNAVDERLPLSRFEVHEGDGDAVIGLTTVPLLGDDGAFVGLLALFTDLTQLRALEARVRQMQTLAEMGEMSAGIAHEFRNSLSTILGYLRLALRQTDVDEIVERIKKAEDEGNSLSRAVDGLLNFARPLALDKRPVELKATAGEVAGRVLGRQRQWRIGGPPVVIDADAALLSRAIENLLRNADEAMRESGRDGAIEIQIADRPLPAIHVIDEGPGVDPNHVPRLFVPFHSTKSTGLGMGLPLARKIALLHGAELRLQNEPGRGARATIEFAADVPEQSARPLLQFAPTSE